MSKEESVRSNLTARRGDVTAREGKPEDGDLAKAIQLHTSSRSKFLVCADSCTVVGKGAYGVCFSTRHGIVKRIESLLDYDVLFHVFYEIKVNLHLSRYLGRMNSAGKHPLSLNTFRKGLRLHTRQRKLAESVADRRWVASPNPFDVNYDGVSPRSTLPEDRYSRSSYDQDLRMCEGLGLVGLKEILEPPRGIPVAGPESSGLFLVLERGPGSLADFLKSRQYYWRAYWDLNSKGVRTLRGPIYFSHVSRRESLKIIFDVLCSVNVLHTLGITHNDIKPGNIIFNAEKLRETIRYENTNYRSEPGVPCEEGYTDEDEYTDEEDLDLYQDGYETDEVDIELESGRDSSRGECNGEPPDGKRYIELETAGMLVNQFCCSLADFGLAIPTDGSYLDHINCTLVTAQYRSHELVMKNDCVSRIAECESRSKRADLTKEFRAQKIQDKSDIWSVGVLFVQMLLGKYMFPVDEKKEFDGRNEDLRRGHLRYFKDRTSRIRFMASLTKTDANLDVDTIDFILRMTDRDPSDRFSALELLQHSVFANERLYRSASYRKAGFSGPYPWTNEFAEELGALPKIQPDTPITFPDGVMDHRGELERRGAKKLDEIINSGLYFRWGENEKSNSMGGARGAKRKKKRKKKKQRKQRKQQQQQ